MDILIPILFASTGFFAYSFFIMAKDRQKWKNYCEVLEKNYVDVLDAYVRLTQQIKKGE